MNRAAPVWGGSPDPVGRDREADPTFGPKVGLRPQGGAVTRRPRPALAVEDGKGAYSGSMSRQMPYAICQSGGVGRRLPHAATEKQGPLGRL
jgi:hypothetical protein